MSSSDLLDIPAIDALLERFRSRQQVQEDLASTTTEFAVDQPNVLCPEALQSMGVRLRMVADRMASDLSATLRSQMSCVVADFSLVRMRSVVDRLSDRCCVIELGVKELGLPAFLSIGTKTAGSIIDRLVGGTGECEALERDLTAIEQRVVGDVVNPVIEAYQSVMSGVAQLTMAWRQFIGSKEQMHAFPPTELFLAANFETKVEGGLEWSFEFLLPIADLTKAIERSASIPVQPVEVAQDQRQGLKRVLCDVVVGSSVEIGKADVSLRDVANLAPGDIIVLDSKPGQLLEFKIGGKPKYSGTLGRCDENMGFKVAKQLSDKAAQQSNKGSGG